jgi:hypothetical protein
MGEILTYDEMKTRYDGEWVLVQDPEVDEHLRVLRGKVISHHVERDAMYQDMGKLRPTHSATLCLRDRSRGNVYVLSPLAIEPA